MDLALEGGAAAQRVSRHQAQLWLEADGGFRLRCTGRRPMWVNGRRVEQGQAAPLPLAIHHGAWHRWPSLIVSCPLRSGWQRYRRLCKRKPTS